MLGDILARAGDRAGASAAWHAALAILPPGEVESPTVMANRAVLLQRLGDGARARALAARLDALGYRHPAYVKAYNQGAKT